MGMRARPARWSVCGLLLCLVMDGAVESVRADTTWCADTRSNVLTDCPDACSATSPCVQYAADAKCSDAARNECFEESGCVYQCLRTYNSIAKHWSLFVKEPAATDSATAGGNPTDKFPAAPVQKISQLSFPEDMKSIQITGFEGFQVPRGSYKAVELEDVMFSSIRELRQLVVANVDLQSMPKQFLPASLADLMLSNCNLGEMPAQIADSSNLVQLTLTKNYIKELPDASLYAPSLSKLTKLDLSMNSLQKFEWKLPNVAHLILEDNQLREFPSVIFDMPNLVSLSLKGNNIKSADLTEEQLIRLKRLSSNSSLGLLATSGSCSEGAKEERLLDSVVCVINSDANGSTDDSSTNSTLLIICIILGVVVVGGGVAFFMYRKKRHQKQFSFHEDSARTELPRMAPSTQLSNPPSRPTLAMRPGRAGSVGSAGRPSRTFRSGASTLNGPTTSAKEPSQYQRSLMGTNPNSTAQTVSRKRRSDNINPNVIRLAFDDIMYTRRIAKGAFGEVWLAQYGADIVAVKKLLALNGAGLDGFIIELNLLSSLSHPRIISLVGACWDDQLNDVQIVTEYMDSGDLLSVLRQRSPSDLTWRNGKQFYCLHICEAVYYLHSLQPALIHRDIKSRNVLVDSAKGAKLSDFGESRERTYQQTMTAGVGTARWVAPEIILGEDYSELADIFSLGVLLTELDTHQIPYETLRLEEAMIVQQVATGKLRPSVSDTCPDVVRQLAHECLQFDPQLRPSASRVLQVLMQSSLVRRDNM